MAYYLIKETLVPCTAEDIKDSLYQYVAVLTTEEYLEARPAFGMGIDIDIDLSKISDTKAIVNYDCLSGTLNIPDHEEFNDRKFPIAFALDERGIVLIASNDYAFKAVEKIRESKKWKFPGMERFVYDFLEETISNDLSLLESVEANLNKMEDSIISGYVESFPAQLNEIRSELLDLHTHYEHLIDVAKELEENENGFFAEENLRYFRLFGDRVERLNDLVAELREYIIQLRDLTSEQLSIRQNNIMTLLTIVTTIFMPLTLIAGWYGMNFTNMPELTSPFGYPVVILSSILIVLGFLIWFKKKKWL